jgi:hypothetical protein
VNIESTNLIPLFIPSIGKCTLFPCIDDLRSKVNTYRTLYEVAKHLDLEEFPPLSHIQTQEIWKTLADTFEEIGANEVRIFISGTHDSYPVIDIRSDDQKLESCVTAMDIYIHNPKKLFGTSNPFVHKISMNLNEVPIHEDQNLAEPFYCLFLSAKEE